MNYLFISGQRAMTEGYRSIPNRLNAVLSHRRHHCGEAGGAACLYIVLAEGLVILN